MELPERMKSYEDNFRNYLKPEDPVVIRIDGSNFSNLTSKLKKPYDNDFINLMNDTAKYVVSNVSGFRFGTVQSDEINIVLQLTHSKQEPYYKNNINKILSLTAAYASSYFTLNGQNLFNGKIIQFDSRVFTLPKEEIVNYFIWRQNDTIRNAIQMTARTYFSHKKVHGNGSEEMKEMLRSIGQDFDLLPAYWRHGRSIYKILVEKESPYDGKIVQRNQIFIDENSPLFVDNKSFVEKHLVL